ncbi:MAG: malic enzyme-like NAD(P)-binding protein, partial [Candidatus Limnocylindrales bacterium]
AEGIAPSEMRSRIVMLDSRGLVFEGRVPLDPDKLEFALGPAERAAFGFGDATAFDLETVVRQVQPTMLIGTSGTPGAFTEGAIREMARHVARPIVFPLSNPTVKTEALPADVIRWTDGRAIVATGSLFEPVEYEGRQHVIGQANNVFIFPGVGLGAMVGEAREVTDEMFLVAAETLAESVSAERLAAGAIYPAASELREVSRRIAVRVVCQARDCGVGRVYHDEDIEAAVDAAMWFPDYVPYLAG